MAYDVTGKVTAVYADAAHEKEIVTFTYDDKGFRLSKTAYDQQDQPNVKTWYVRDAAGNVMSTYEQNLKEAQEAKPVEMPIYGSSRIGVYKPQYKFTFYEVQDHLGNGWEHVGGDIDPVATYSLNEVTVTPYSALKANYPNTWQLFSNNTNGNPYIYPYKSPDWIPSIVGFQITLTGNIYFASGGVTLGSVVGRPGIAYFATPEVSLTTDIKPGVTVMASGFVGYYEGLGKQSFDALRGNGTTTILSVGRVSVSRSRSVSILENGKAEIGGGYDVYSLGGAIIGGGTGVSKSSTYTSLWQVYHR